VDSRERLLAELAEVVGGAAGVLPTRVRRDLVSGNGIAGNLGELAELVAAGGHGRTGEHIRSLLNAGYSEDAVFECVVAAAVGAAWRRLRAVERLMGARRP
jgi:hypothetical protein